MQNKMRECRKLMQEVARNQNAAKEDEKTVQRNNIFFDSYDKHFKISMNSFFVVKKEFNFSPSPMTMNALQQAIKDTQESFQTTVVSNPIRYRDCVANCCKKLQEEWERFIQQDIADIQETLKIVRLIPAYKSQATDLLKKLEASCTWPVSEVDAKTTFNAKSKAKTILSELQFDEHISAFLKKIQAGTATLVDLTPEVQTWIERENLADKIMIRL